MDKKFKKSPQLDYPIDEISDSKYVSGLSTILVATIQEAKDRMSQIEYIFCSQLFPNFQSQSKSLQKLYSDAREAAEIAWKNKESDLMLQIERLQLENKTIREENQSLKLKNAKLATNSSGVYDSEKKLKELEEKNNMLLRKQKTLELEDEELRGEFLKKSKEVDESMELQNRLLQLVQSKASVILQKEKQLTELEQKKNKLLVQIDCLEKNVSMIEEQLREKSNEVIEEQKLQEKLLKENNLYVLKNLNNQRLLDECDKEKKLLMERVESLEGRVNELQRELKSKNEEAEEGKKLQEQYLEQIDLNTKELSRTRQQVEKLEKENMSLVITQKSLQNKIDNLGLKKRVNETSEELELHGKLLKQIEEKDLELQAEKKKRRDFLGVYKNLKSQYNFLLAKIGVTNEGKDESNSSMLGQNPLTFPDNGMRAINSNSPTASMEPINTRSAALAGTKRPASSWRETRSHQQKGGYDPHDNFLDTPLENIIGNINKSAKDKQVHEIPDHAPREINFDSSETQDLAGDLAFNKPIPEPGVKSGFKYIEPVRKRADRENLKGIECKQCSKFYDAVLPEGGDENKNTDLRCEHHDGVSRHRYRFAPPSTPEGFWNIGFESEM